MNEIEEKLQARISNLSLKLSDALKKISALTLGQKVPRRLQDILRSATFHLGMAQRQYKQMLADPTLGEQDRKKLQGQSDDCADLLGLFRFIRIPDRAKEVA